MITGVGGPAGIALMSAGISVGMQKATTGHVDLLHVGIDVDIGLGTAGLGALAAPRSARRRGRWYERCPARCAASPRAPQRR